jgi:DNA-binding beta-propeller fold protein YncE
VAFPQPPFERRVAGLTSAYWSESLGGAARSLCVAETGSAPRRPHMLVFNAGESHAILAFVATGHVLFMDAASRTPIRCIDVGLQAHAAFPSPDETYVVVANQNDSTATPMSIVGEYDNATVHPNGCGGLETAGKMYVNSGGGTPANPLESDLHAFPLGGFSTAPNPPNTPAPTLIFSHDARGFVDSHGATLTKHARYLWVADRAANRIVVVDTRSDIVVNEIALTGTVSPDPAPDLMGISPDGNRVYVSLRGPTPLTGNVPGVSNAVGGTPGVGILRVTSGGRSGRLQAVAPISHVVGGVETADPHGLAVRETE